MAKAKKASQAATSTSTSADSSAGNNAPNSRSTPKGASSKPKKPTAIDTLRTVVPSIFQESQKTVANHRKNSIMLRKIQEQCAEIAGEQGEEAFNKEFIRNLNVVLAVKKKDPVADRVIQFVSTFILCTREKDIVVGTETEDEEGSEGISSRFVEYLMHHLLKGVRVKEKLVRLRCCQLIALSTNSLGAMDDDLYTQLKSSLMERVKDKESAVRVQAVFALSKLQGEEESGDNEDNVVQKLVDMMQHDMSSEVRRSALFNIEQSKETLPFILERARDIDPYNRRSVFAKPMDELSDFRKLSIGERERLLRYGLSDRDEGVKKACAKMVATKWIQQADDNLIEFLQRLDVMSSDVADDVLRAFFDYRADIIGNLTFDDVFWFNLTVESALLVRAYAEFCRSKDDDIQFEKAVPEVTRHAFYIQKYSNMMQEAEEENRPEAEFIVTQLLMIAKLLDYADENGRRKMFNLLREMLMLDDIPDKHLDCIVETMGKISLNEKDFTRIVIEIISDIRTSIDEQEYLRNPEGSDDDDDSPDDQTLDMADTPRKRKRSISRRRSSVAAEDIGKAPSEMEATLIRIRCLTITKFMLERSEEPLTENSYMYGLLNELVIPALARHEEVMQQLGLQCLGLICALDQALAQGNMELFLTCIFADNANDTLHALSLKIVFDLLLTFGMKNMAANITEDRIITDLSKVLESTTPELQAIAAEGLAKLMLTKLLKNAQILRTLITMYFDPETANNNHLRQCLSYFMQVYFHSAHENQVILSEIFVPILVHLIQLYQDSKTNMPTPTIMAQQLLEWCEPRRVLGADTENDINNIDFGLPADIAINLVKAMFTESLETRKFLPGILFKIRLDADAGEIRLKKLTLLLGNLKHKRPFQELSAKKYIQSIEKNILKMFDDAPEALDDDELNKLAELTEEVSFLDGFEPPEDSIEEVIKAPPVLRERRKKASKAQASAKLAKIMEDIDAILQSDSDKETAEGDDSAGSDSDANIVEDDEDDDDFE
ncbi:condensin complex subunit 3 [Entomortierella parvispora]|uniref:Condensin complex subunit 3 n=1 Tax=Entomortierella parvispora TaxID=205924 RepID=A0A9P3H257_9FUNG|nr:condensin complex subunit 3 [Entomortierella parvispora]